MNNKVYMGHFSVLELYCIPLFKIKLCSTQILFQTLEKVSFQHLINTVMSNANYFF